MAKAHSYLLSVSNVLSSSPAKCIFSGQVGCPVARKIRVVVTGTIQTPLPGDVFEVTGQWKKDGEYGWQLYCDVSDVKRRKPTGSLIGPFLIERLPGVGHERARKLIDTYGSHLDVTLSDPQRIPEIAALINSGLSAFSVRIATAIHMLWKELHAEFAVIEWLEAREVTNQGLARELVKVLGNDTVTCLDKNPYVLATVLKWRQLDNMGLKILERASEEIFPHRDARRLLGAIDSVMQDAVSEGDTAVPKNDFPALLSLKLSIAKSDPLIEEAIRIGVKNKGLTNGGHVWRAPGCAFLEDDLERRLHSIAGGYERSQINVPHGDTLATFVRHILSTQRISLSEEQVLAVCKVLSNPLALLTGGAGTGKTTTTRAICASWEALGGRVQLAALAGKAALRCREATGRQARTIYRLLKAVENLEYDEDSLKADDLVGIHPLDDRTLLIVDEASMVDLGQWHRLSEAMKSGCRLLMVGDTFQLPPIGFGLVFHLLAGNETITARLKTIHRQSEATGIPAVAAAIREQQMPLMSAYEGVADGVSFLETPETEIPRQLMQVVKDLGGFPKSTHELQIIAALNQGQVSALSINRLFHDLNTVCDQEKAVKGFLGQYFAVGDPVMHTRNDYMADLFNGSLGHVTELSRSGRSIKVKFEDGVERQFAGNQLIDLQLAYAITCHRSQGSQAERVIIPLCDSRLNDPTWLYTAVTRATKQCVLVGQRRLLEEALKRMPKHMQRCIGTRFSKI